MKVFNANKVKPNKSGYYMTFTVVRVVGGYHVVTTDMQYNAESDGWNIGMFDRENEMHPDFWAQLPNGERMLDGLEEEIECLEF